jgi:hypothetical protein
MNVSNSMSLIFLKLKCLKVRYDFFKLYMQTIKLKYAYLIMRMKYLEFYNNICINASSIKLQNINPLPTMNLEKIFDEILFFN